MPNNFTYRPPSFLQIGEEQFKPEVDKAISKIYDSHALLNSTAIKAPANGAGFAVMSGEATVTGSKLGLATGLATVQQVIASIDNGAVATNFWVTSRVTPTDHSKIDLFVWMPTAIGNTTPIANATPVTIRWWTTGVAL